MIVITDTDFDAAAESIRKHPWINTEDDPQNIHCYRNFIINPTLIRTSLVEFSQYNQPAIETFYQMLEWLNGPTSPFETNDCALSKVDPTNKGCEQGKLVIGGRVEILFRNWVANTDGFIGNIGSLWKLFGIYAQINRPNFHKALITIKGVRTEYYRVPVEPKFGLRLRLSFVVYGDTDGDIFDNLNECFIGMFSALKNSAAAIEVKAPIGLTLLPE